MLRRVVWTALALVAVAGIAFAIGVDHGINLGVQGMLEFLGIPALPPAEFTPLTTG
jgi:hypothetical protein